MTFEECKTLVNGLLAASRNMSVHWTEGANEDQFVGSYAGVIISIERADDGLGGSIVTVELRNGVGQLIDDARSDRFSELRGDLESLFGAARRSARGGDHQIMHLLQVLKNETE